MVDKKTTDKPVKKVPRGDLRSFMMKSLQQIDATTDPAMPFGAPAADRHLKRLIKRLKLSFPERDWTAPSGVVWKGSELPQEVLDAALPKANSNRVCGNLLNMAVELLGNDEAHLKWLLASGFNPNRYSQQNNNTPVGGLAMRGKHVGLRVCREAGYDLRAFIGPEHISSIPKQRQVDLLGTTLLHRVARHAIAFKSDEIAAKTINELLLAGLDPAERSANGKSCLDMATGPAVEVLQKWIAQQQAQELDGQTVASVAPGRTPRL